MPAPPAFWSRPPDRPGWAARLLAPLGRLYAAGTRRRLSGGRYHDPGVPVVCVGNLSVGGTGKTPTVIALMMHLTSQGWTPHVVTRGYGGRLDGPVRVDPHAHDAGDTGDEPLLIAAFGPVWVSKDRAAGADAAVAAGANIILLDDGFQNPDLKKSLSILVVDARRGFGNGRCLPAGPLREPVEVGVGRADILLAIGTDAERAALVETWPALGALPSVDGRITPLRTGMDWADMRVLAFAGIGHPEKFFDTLRGLGVDLAGTRALSDHAELTPALLRRLQADAAALGAQLVTTEKDAVRLPASMRGQVLTLPVRLEGPDWAVVDGRLPRPPVS
ncbi:tetraacyldisaccharide 4'-kinase [Oceanomicrobium pacificus]|uniref:Tetraacyldisaccharide 4'-kinase n=1 Tax=Oceanomicrobium pacificus TaxID=2692916 RepID=A0A6B0TUC5_9RHOB|nr:tetraacyldisaccharide 4'-kinase [Oceanomicrobium pacificus]MXU64842.1 tetraacyldisaccharide 4'-kinase [Oceanomicrobium pacificus]